MYTLNITHDQAIALQAIITNHKHKSLEYAVQAARKGDTFLHDLHADDHKALTEVQIMVDDLLLERI